MTPVAERGPRIVERRPRLSTSLHGQFAQSALQEPAFRFLAGKLERPLVGRPGFRGPPEAAAQVGPSRMGQVVVGKITTIEDRVDERESRRRSVAQSRSQRRG